MTASGYRLVEVTGDSLAAANNMLAAEGEIGAGRDITTIVPGGFTSAGAVNGNLRPRAAAAFAYGALGNITAVPAVTGPPAVAAYDAFTPANLQPYFTIEKKAGDASLGGNQHLYLQYTDCIVNTLNIAANAGALSTFSAGLMTAGENTPGSAIVDETQTGQPYSYQDTSNDLLVFHGGKIQIGDTGGSLVENDQFQSLEVVINNNVQGDEYTIRPSRFIHSFTEGIRSVEVNMTIIFNDYTDYQKYTYGTSGATSPGYHLYQGQLDFTLANWQLGSTETYSSGDGTGNVPATKAQAIHFYLPQVTFAGLPVTLTTGRIVVTTNGRATRPITTATPIVALDVRPTAAAF